MIIKNCQINFKKLICVQVLIFVICLGIDVTTWLSLCFEMEVATLHQEDLCVLNYFTKLSYMERIRELPV